VSRYFCTVGGSRMWARSMLQRHWLATVLLAVLISLASGVVVAAVAAAGRADGSIERFTARNRAFDAIVFSCPPGVDPSNLESQYEMSTTCLSYQRAREAMSELAAMPGVEALNMGGDYVVGVLDEQAPNGWGRISLLTATLGNDPTLLVGHPKQLTGRLPSANARDEVVLSERAARENGLGVGDRVTIASWPLEELDEAVNAGAAPDLTTALTLRVVGIGRFQSDLAQGEVADVSGNYFAGELHTAGPSGQAVRGFSNYGIAPFVRLADGLDGIDAFNRVLASRWEDRIFSVEPNRTTLGESRTSEQRIDTERHGVLTFAVIAAIATAGFAGLTLLRQLRREQADIQSLRDLGMDKRDLVIAGLLRALAIAAPAALLVVVVAVALSPLGPVGLARRAEPNIAVHADVAVLVTGAALVLVFVLAVGLVAPLLGLRRGRETRGASASGRLSAWAINLGAVARIGMSFVASTWPRIAAGVMAAALAAWVTAGIAVASLDRVLQSPERFGAWWDGDFGDYSDPEALAAGSRVLSADRDVAVLAGYDSQSDVAMLDGTHATLAAYWPVKGSAAPVVTRGRAPRDEGEIALGATMLKNLGVEVGDTVSLSSAKGPSPFEDRALTVTGVVLFNDPITSTENLGDGGFVTPELLDALSPNVPQRLLARFSEGADPGEVIERVAHTFAGPIRAVVPPDDLRNLQHLRSLPWLLALLVGALAAVTLAHALIVTVQQRRRDLALLSVFGMSRWRIRQVTAFSTLVIVALATIMGIAAGLICGRLLWDLLATEVGLASGPVRTWFQPLELALGMLAAAELVTVIATRRLTSATPAQFLRSE
jgi:FtsX-like permease family